MHRILLICVIISIKSNISGSTTPTESSDIGLTAEQIIKKYGYPFEEHTIQTSDGYLLTLHRIPYGVKNNNTEKPRPAVLIMHGFIGGSIDFVIMGPEKALSFLLADAGYDVWLGNQRGNTWSRKHIEIDPDKENAKFFNFSLHEIGTLDLPAKIDYILATTKQDSLFYIGYSQGTTAVFILLSTTPEYNAKIKMVAALAPLAYSKHPVSPLLTIFDGKYDLLTKIINFFSSYEFLPNHSITVRSINVLCSVSILKEVCALGIYIIAGLDHPELDGDFLRVATTNYPAGAATKQLLHYFQRCQSDKFSYYDHGSAGNLEAYGQAEPPVYNLSKITTPVFLHYGENDQFISTKDVERLAEELPNAQMKLVPRSTFDHMDFIWATNIVELLNNDVVSEIESFT